MSPSVFCAFYEGYFIGHMGKEKDLSLNEYEGGDVQYK